MVMSDNKAQFAGLKLVFKPANRALFGSVKDVMLIADYSGR